MTGLHMGKMLSGTSIEKAYDEHSQEQEAGLSKTINI